MKRKDTGRGMLLLWTASVYALSFLCYLPMLAQRMGMALPGGAERGNTSAVQAVIPTRDLAKGAYTVYLTLKDPGSAQEILLANTQDAGPYGYCLGEIEVRR